MSIGKKIVLSILILVLFIITIYFLFLKKITLSPSTCFNKSDREIIIISDKKCQLDSLLRGPSADFFSEIQHKIDYNQAFLSLNKSKILFSFQSELTTEKIKSLLKLLGYKSIETDGFYKLDNNWRYIYNDFNLFFFKGDFKAKESGLILKKSKQDFSIYNTLERCTIDFKTEDNKLIKTYQNKFKTSFLNKNDFQLFSNVIPKGIEKYSFYDKKYAEKNLIIEKGTSFFEIINQGFCIFSFKGNEFIIADCNKNKDPYQIFDAESGVEEIVPGLRKKYQNLFLTSETSTLNSFFYADFIKGKLVFCQSKEQYDELFKLITHKNSILSSNTDLDFLFNHQSKKVIFRKSDSFQQVVISSKHNVFQESVFIKNKNVKLNPITYNSIENIRHIVGIQNYIFVFTDDELIKIKDDKILEKVKYKGEIIGVPSHINTKDQEGIFFTTSEKLYYLDQNFRANSGFPIVLKNKPQLPFVFPTNSSNILIGYSEKKIFSICDASGNVKEKISLNLNDIKNPISFFESDGLVGIIYDNTSAQFIDIKKNKLLNKISLNYENTVFLTTDSYQAFYYIENNKLIRNDFNGELKKCAKGQKLFNLKTFPLVGVIGVLSNKNLAVFDAEGECVTKIVLPNNRIKDYSIISNLEGGKYIIMFDDLSNDVYIYNFEGETVLKSPLKGDKNFYIHGIGRNIEIYTVIKNKLVKYLI